MNDITAAIALEQYKKLPMYMERRSQIHNFYNEALGDLEWLDLPLPIADDCTSSYYFYHIQTKNDKRDQLAAFLRENNIYTTYRYYPLHRVPGYGVTGIFENADYAADHTLCLPLHQSLSHDDVSMVIDKVREFSKKYC
jgi:aminotransferase